MATLSVCMIARDSARDIARALDSVRDLADQIVVVDTGSLDDTRDIARNAGAEVYAYEWREDLSAARNTAFDRATSDWILWLDSDEWLDPATADALRDAIERPDAFAYWVTRRDLETLTDLDRGTEMSLQRLFRNRPDARLRRRIHEWFDPLLETLAEREGMTVEVSGVRLFHAGYCDGKAEQKHARNLRLVELELADTPDDLYFHVERFRTLAAMKDPLAREALNECVERIGPNLDDPTPPLALLASLFEILLQLKPSELPGVLDTDRVRSIALRWFPDSPPVLFRLAHIAFGEQRFEEAEPILERLVEMGRTARYDRMGSFDPRIINEDALLNLGACRLRLAKLDDAQHAFEQLLASGRRTGEARANLEAIAQIRERLAR